MTASANGRPPIASPVGGLPSTWEERAAKLARLMIVVVDAKAHATVLSAKAYLDADGIGGQRENVAKLAAVEAQQDVGHAQAELEAYRLLLDIARSELEER